ncbi:MAG: glycosyltransferase [Patescibacteria group bacterium]
MTKHDTKKEIGICVVVLGMHRSGTSAVSGSLARAGVFFGDNLLPAAPYNPKGFYEHLDILHTNEEILRTFNSSFEDIKPLPELWYKSISMIPFKERLREIIERDFADVSVFGFKDPRISILLPLYLELFEEMNLDARLIVCERSSFEIALSLKERINFSLYESLALCKKYKQAIEEGVKGKIFVRVQMNDIANDPLKSIDGIISILNLPIQITEAQKNAITDFVDIKLKHHTLSTEEVAMDLIKEKEEGLRQLQISTEDKECALEHLLISEGLKAKKEQEIKLLNQNLRDEKENSVKQVEGLNEEIVRLQNKLFEKTEYASLFESQVERLNHTLAHRDHQLQFLEQEISRFDGIDPLQHSRIEAEINNLRDNLASIHRSVSWKIVSLFQRTLDSIIMPGSALRRPYVKFLRRVQDVSLKKKDMSHVDNTEISHDKPLEITLTKPVDILFINHEESLTGAPRIILEIAKDAMKKYSIAIISKIKGGMSEEFQETFFGKLFYPLDLLEQRERHTMARLMLEKIKPKLVYVNSIVSYEYAAEAKKLGIPVIFHIHEMASAYEVAVSHEAHHDFASFADLFIAVSEVTKRDLMKIMNVPEDRIRIIHEFVDAHNVLSLSKKQSQTEVEEMLNISPDDLLIVSIGTFDKRKGADFFAKIAKRIYAANTQNKQKIKMLWVGRRPHQHDLFAPIYKKYREYFLHINEVRNPFPFLARADIFFLASREDPFPLVVLEAMSLQKPIVSFTRSGGASEAAEGSIVLVDNFDAEDAYKALQKLAQDGNERKCRGILGQERQKLFEKSISLKKISLEIERALSL